LLVLIEPENLVHFALVILPLKLLDSLSVQWLRILVNVNEIAEEIPNGQIHQGLFLPHNLDQVHLNKQQGFPEEIQLGNIMV